MGFKVDIKGFDKALKDIEKLAKETREDVQIELNAFGLDVQQQAKQLAPANEGLLRNRIDVLPGNLEVSVVASVEYAAYLEFGTRKFAAQYVSSLPADWQTYAASFRGAGPGGGGFMERLLVWMNKKGIEESAAYPIARKIMRDGIRPQPFLYPAYRDNVPKLKANLKKIFK